MITLQFDALSDEQRALVERIFREHYIHFQRISLRIVQSEEIAEDVVSSAFVKIMDNIELGRNFCGKGGAVCRTVG